VTAQFARWDQPSGARIRVGGWYGHRFGRHLTVRMWAERSHGEAATERVFREETTAGLQCIVEIQRLFGR
jgi:hypothetical protein